MLTLAYFLNGLILGLAMFFFAALPFKLREILGVITMVIVGSFIGYLIFSSWVLIVKSLI